MKAGGLSLIVHNHRLQRDWCSPLEDTDIRRRSCRTEEATAGLQGTGDL
jgi:hypothetical protein